MEPYPETRMLLHALSKTIDAGIPYTVSMIDPFKQKEPSDTESHSPTTNA